VPKLCHMAGDEVQKPLIFLVGVAGFEPATPSSRTTLPSVKYLKNRTISRRNSVNRRETFAHFCAVSVPPGATP
jgi:hypothetical protein